MRVSSSQHLAVVRKYKTKEALLVRLNPEIQDYALNNPDKAFIAQSPTVRIVDEAFGKGTAYSWFVTQLADLNEFCGCAGKMSNYQISNLSNILVSGFAFLKMSEFLLFFGRLKMGCYGKFYGAIDPLQITCWLQKFIRERSQTLDRIRAEQNAKEDLSKPKEKTMSRSEYEAYRKQNQHKHKI